jgi:cation diffusion facilitator CzcD-associated flavoprotein CzcO
VDTTDNSIERVTESGVVVNGVEYELDCLIFATGFEVGTACTRRAGFGLYGRDGLSLADYWAKGMRTYHGFLSPGVSQLLSYGTNPDGA